MRILQLVQYYNNDSSIIAKIRMTDFPIPVSFLFFNLIRNLKNHYSHSNQEGGNG